MREVDPGLAPGQSNIEIFREEKKKIRAKETGRRHPGELKKN